MSDENPEGKDHQSSKVIAKVSGDLKVAGNMGGRDVITTTQVIHNNWPAILAVVAVVVLAVVAIVAMVTILRLPPPPSTVTVPTIIGSPPIQAVDPLPTASIPIATPTPTNTITSTPSRTPTNTPTPTPTHTLTHRPTFTSTHTPTPIPPTATQTPEPPRPSDTPIWTEPPPFDTPP